MRETGAFRRDAVVHTRRREIPRRLGNRAASRDQTTDGRRGASWHRASRPSGGTGVSG
ncbi:hypothetical protein Cus16_1991 [Curtobacterium sp. ER1/6]|nr:hypothetical protein Cus16_1991 [Curtobacterium sp. ER1/6]